MRRSVVRSVVRSAAVTGALALAVGPAVIGAPAAEAARPDSDTLVKRLSTPLSVAVARGAVLVTENFSATLVAKTGTHRSERTRIGRPGDEIGGLSATKHAIYLTWTPAHGRAKVIRTSLGSSKTTLVGNVGKYEADHNPDAGTTYGFRDIDESCASQFPDGTPPAYQGGIDSHPYATAAKGRTTYVADAGANAILAAKDREVSTVAVLPAIPVVITEDAATANDMPDCVVGLTYWLEPVPTDVEVGPDGMLYVSSLPGGPEDGSLGPLGSVFVVDPHTGETTTLASGFLGATGLAVAKNGDVYVAELFADRISLVPAGGGDVEKFVGVRNPAALVVRGSLLVATVNALSGADGGAGHGKVVVFVR